MGGRLGIWIVAAIAVVVAVAPAAARRGQPPPTGAIRGRLGIQRLAAPPQPRPGVGEHGGRAGRGTADVRRGLVYLDTAPRGAFDEPEPGRGGDGSAQRDVRAAPARRDDRHRRGLSRTATDLSQRVLAVAGRRFDLGRYAAARSKSVRFDRPGVVRVFCDIHSHMSAFIVVFNHPFFRVTDADGRFRLDSVPAGHVHRGRMVRRRGAGAAAASPCPPAASSSSIWWCRDRALARCAIASSSPARCWRRPRSAPRSTS